MNRTLTKFLFWEYSRETSVYVIFCLLIIAFIFLTPKTWFDKRETLATRTSRIIVQRSEFSPDKAVMIRKIRELSGDPQAEIVDTRERTDAAGETFYEIEIR